MFARTKSQAAKSCKGRVTGCFHVRPGEITRSNRSECKRCPRREPWEDPDNLTGEPSSDLTVDSTPIANRGRSPGYAEWYPPVGTSAD